MTSAEERFRAAADLARTISQLLVLGSRGLLTETDKRRMTEARERWERVGGHA